MYFNYFALCIDIAMLRTVVHHVSDADDDFVPQATAKPAARKPAAAKPAVTKKPKKGQSSASRATRYPQNPVITRNLSSEVQEAKTITCEMKIREIENNLESISEKVTCSSANSSDISFWYNLFSCLLLPLSFDC